MGLSSFFVKYHGGFCTNICLSMVLMDSPASMGSILLCILLSSILSKLSIWSTNCLPCVIIFLSFEINNTCFANYHMLFFYLFCFSKISPSLVTRIALEGYKNVRSESIIYKRNDQGKDQGDDISIAVLESRLWTHANFFHNCNNLFLFFKITFEESSKLSYYPHTITSKLCHNFSNISHGWGIMNSYCLL